MFGIGTTELIIILLVALVILGPAKLPGMARSLGKALGKPTLLPPVPGFVVKMMKGEFGSTLLNGQRVVPKRLLTAGFRFHFPDIAFALTDLFGESRRGIGGA